MRNTVVRTTIKVNGKPQILGTRSPQTLKSIDLKSDLDDYVGGLTLCAKNGTNRPSRVSEAKGWNIILKMGSFFFLSFLYFSCQALENTFLGVLPHSLHWMMCFGGDWFPRGSQHSSFIFPPFNPPKTANFRPIFRLLITTENAEQWRCSSTNYL